MYLNPERGPEEDPVYVVMAEEVLSSLRARGMGEAGLMGRWVWRPRRDIQRRRFLICTCSIPASRNTSPSSP